jgi:mRNA-degrading endonuclease toxin of MazEF toxin-antitoxin module
LGFALTSKEKKGKFYLPVSHNKRISYVILSQLRTYSAKRIKYCSGKIDKKTIKEVHENFIKIVTPSN